MAIFNRLSEEEIKKDYSHYALMYSFVPIYVGDIDGENRICVRNWYPEILLDFGDAIFDICSIVIQTINPEYEPMFFFKITGEIK